MGQGVGALKKGGGGDGTPLRTMTHHGVYQVLWKVGSQNFSDFFV